jgi:hypothetical protein
MRKGLMILGLFLFCTSTASAGWKPSGMSRWDDSSNADKHLTRIGGAIANYKRGADSGWAPISNNIAVESDSGWSFKESFMSTHLDTNGTSSAIVNYGGATYTVTQKLNRVMWLKTDTWDTLTIFKDPDFTTYTTDSNEVLNSSLAVDSIGLPTWKHNEVRWTNVFPQVDYSIVKENGSLAHYIRYKKLFLDSAVVLYNQRADSADIALANVMVYTLSSNLDSADQALGNINRRKLKQVGKRIFGLGASQLYFTDWNKRKVIKVNQRWVKWDNKIICVEYVSMSVIKQIHEAYPNSAIWHNATTNITGADIEDTRLGGLSTNRDIAFGATPTITVRKVTNRLAHALVRATDIAGNLGVDQLITDTDLYIYVDTEWTSTIVRVYALFKYWIEGDDDSLNNNDGDATWNDWASDNSEWGTAGASNLTASVVSSNTGDGSGVDAYSGTMAQVSLAVGMRTISLDGAPEDDVANRWYDGTNTEDGYIIRISSNNDSSLFRSVEYTGTSSDPYYVFTHEYVAPPASNPTRRIRMLKQLGVVDWDEIMKPIYEEKFEVVQQPFKVAQQPYVATN